MTELQLLARPAWRERANPAARVQRRNAAGRAPNAAQAVAWRRREAISTSLLETSRGPAESAAHRAERPLRASLRLGRPGRRQRGKRRRPDRRDARFLIGPHRRSGAAEARRAARTEGRRAHARGCRRQSDAPGPRPWQRAARSSTVRNVGPSSALNPRQSIVGLFRGTCASAAVALWPESIASFAEA